MQIRTAHRASGGAGIAAHNKRLGVPDGGIGLSGGVALKHFESRSDVPAAKGPRR